MGERFARYTLQLFPFFSQQPSGISGYMLHVLKSMFWCLFTGILKIVLFLSIIAKYICVTFLDPPLLIWISC